MDGDPTDVCSLATYLAFQDLKLPKVHPIVGENGVMEDFEVVSDLASSLRPDFSGLPLIIAIGKVSENTVYFFQRANCVKPFIIS